MNDFVGNPIKPGSIVVYPVRRGSDMWLSKMTVTMVDEAGLRGFNDLGRRVQLKNIQNVVVVGERNGKSQ